MTVLSTARTSRSATVARRPLVPPRTRPLVMGILNVTPDSFSDGGRYLDPGRAVECGLRLIAEGADVLDIGGESTRPGAQPVAAEEELRRVLPVIERLARSAKVPLSIDTAKADVAERALGAGATIINDVTALEGDARMASVAARFGAQVVLMHMRGTPRTMQARPRYRSVVGDVAAYLTRRARAAEAAGISAGRVWIDPGLGFGKTVAHNLQIMAGLKTFVALGYPVMLGPSRKSFIGATLEASVEDRLAGTLACVALAQQAGVRMVRVHDVKPAADVIRMLEAIGEHAARR